MSVNKVILVGRLGKSPELRQTEKSNIVSFTLATSEKYAGNETTQWHNCKAFGQTADNINKFFAKGDMIYVEGKISYNVAEKDGVKRTFTDIIVNTFAFVGGKKQDVPSAAGQPDAPAESVSNDGLPF